MQPVMTGAMEVGESMEEMRALWMRRSFDEKGDGATGEGGEESCSAAAILAMYCIDTVLP